MLQEVNLEQKTSSHMLKAEIRQLYKEKKDGNKDEISKLKASAIFERKFTINKEMLEKLTEEKKKLLKENFDLKRRADTLESKYIRALNENKKNVERAIKMPAVRGARGGPVSTKSEAGWSSLLSSDQSERHAAEPNPSILEDAKSKNY